MKENKEIGKRAIKPVDNIKKIREEEARKKERKWENDSWLKKEVRKNTEIIHPTTHVQNVIGEGHFIPVKVRKSSDDDYIEYENDGDTLSKTLPVMKCLDKIREDLANTVKRLKSGGSLWKLTRM